MKEGSASPGKRPMRARVVWRKSALCGSNLQAKLHTGVRTGALEGCSRNQYSEGGSG